MSDENSLIEILRYPGSRMASVVETAVYEAINCDEPKNKEQKRSKSTEVKDKKF